jgi:type I restriction-modification system DNA methylase subunit
MGKAWSCPVQVASPIKPQGSTTRYKNTGIKKSEGATFTPSILADFVASQILATFKSERNEPIRLLDPAVGDGELLCSLLKQIDPSLFPRIRVVGFDINNDSVEIAQKRLRKL